MSPSVVSPRSPVAAPSAPVSDTLLARRLSLLTGHLVVALVALVVIGGATRVMEAGLACPDWPLCYGSLLPGRQMNLQVFLEWFHRLDAFVVGVALLVLAGVAVAQRRLLPRGVPLLAGAALVLVAVQGLLGALTVTRLLAAPVVTAHLGTALVLVALVSALYQRLELPARRPLPAVSPQQRAAVAIATLLVLSQCLLGGAMASQWAADLCLAAGQGCRWLLWHRQLAGVAALAVLAMAVFHPQRRWAGAIAALVMAQLVLGTASLRLQLAVPSVTVAHQLLAALLVAALAALMSRSLRADG